MAGWRAGGEYEVGGCCFELAFVVNEQHGTWGQAQPVRGLARLGAAADGINSVSCGSAARDNDPDRRGPEAGARDVRAPATNWMIS